MRLCKSYTITLSVFYNMWLSKYDFVLYTVVKFKDITTDPKCKRKFGYIDWESARIVIGIDHDTVCAGVVGTAIRHSTRPYKWSIEFYHDHNFIKSKGNLRFRRLVPLFVPIGGSVTTHDDGTASDVTIGMWRHNQQATNHERNGKPWFFTPKVA